MHMRHQVRCAIHLNSFFYFVMKPSLALFYTVLACLSFSQTSSADATTTTAWQGAATIKFEGTSTLHAWSGTVDAQPFLTTVSMGDSSQPSALKARVEVHAADMDTKEPKRDENMRKAMRVVDYPLVVGDFDASFASLSPDGSMAPQKLPFQISILGKKQKVEGVVSNWKQKEGKASFDVDFDLSLKACGIQVPSVMLVIRVGDTVKVHVNVTLTKTQA
jgi:hypothetical protein